MPQQRVLIVPGNHDIDRSVEEDAFFGARARLQGPEAVDEFLLREDRRTTLFRRQRSFREFVNRFQSSSRYTESSYAHASEYLIRGIAVRVILADSSWLCAGGPGDAHSIVVGEKQLIDAFGHTDHSALTVLLMHHPFSWLAPFEQGPVQNLVADRCHLLFRGHVHDDSVEAVGRVNNQLLVRVV